MMDPMAEAAAELGCDVDELAGTFPPGFGEPVPDPEDQVYELVSLFLDHLNRLGDLSLLDRAVLDDLHRAKNALERVDEALTPSEEEA